MSLLPQARRPQPQAEPAAERVPAGEKLEEESQRFRPYIFLIVPQIAGKMQVKLNPNQKITPALHLIVPRFVPARAALG